MKSRPYLTPQENADLIRRWAIATAWVYNRIRTGRISEGRGLQYAERLTRACRLRGAYPVGVDRIRT